MAEGQGHERWAHTSMICALIANVHRDPKKQRPFTPDDFNPYATRKQRTGSSGDAIEVNESTIGLMRAAFKGQGIQCDTSTSERG
ncbi:MAG: hypothetical protein GC159_12980 [Phycisphaera sp.]|nr:hypothetical protein [Phycisphaera sp.]